MTGGEAARRASHCAGKSGGLASPASAETAGPQSARNSRTRVSCAASRLGVGSGIQRLIWNASPPFVRTSAAQAIISSGCIKRAPHEPSPPAFMTAMESEGALAPAIGANKMGTCNPKRAQNARARARRVFRAHLRQQSRWRPSLTKRGAEIGLRPSPDLSENARLRSSVDNPKFLRHPSITTVKRPCWNLPSVCSRFVGQQEVMGFLPVCPSFVTLRRWANKKHEKATKCGVNILLALEGCRITHRYDGSTSRDRRDCEEAAARTLLCVYIGVCPNDSGGRGTRLRWRVEACNQPAACIGRGYARRKVRVA